MRPAGPTDAIEAALAEALEAALPAVVDKLAAVGGPRAYSVHEVAERLAVSDQTVYNLIRSGRLAKVPHLDPVRVAASTLADFISGKAS